MNSYLAKVIMATLSTIALAGAAHGQESYCYDNSCVVFPPYDDVGGDPYPDGPPGDSGGDSGAGDGDGDGDGDTPPPPICALLLAVRPQGGCTNFIEKPAGALYGPTYSSNSALGRMGNFYTEQNAFLQMRDEISRGLREHTQNIANGMSFIDSNARLRGVISDVCENILPQLLDTTDPYAQMIERGVSNQFCVTIAERFDEEASGFQGFINWLSNDFSNVGSFDYNDVPWSGTFVNLFGYENSLQQKYAAVVVDATCSNWWAQMGANKCTS